MAEPRGRPRLESPPDPSVTEKRCSECGSLKGPGLHKICSKSKRQENVEEMIEASGQLMRERIVSSQLRDIAQASGSDSRGARLQLATGCSNTHLTATIGGGREAQRMFAPKILFHNEELNELQVSLGGGCSDNHMKIITHYMRTKCGRTSVTGHREYMTQRNHLFDDIFDWQMIPQKAYMSEDTTFDDNGKKTKKKKSVIDVVKPCVFVTDMQEFATQVMVHREYDPDNVFCSVGLDDGGGFLKIMLTIKPNEVIQVEEGAKKRRSYEEVFKPTQFKDGGQNKIQILAMAPTCERHDNIATILDLMNINNINFGLCADLKMQLILIGKQSASSKHNCPYCSDVAPWVGQNRQSLTIGQLYVDYAKFQALREELGEAKALKKAQTCNNTINRPLIQGPYDQKILGQTILFPELHIFTGVISKLEKEIEKHLFESEKAGHTFMDEFFSEQGISRAVYHGTSNFVGQQAKKLLKKVPELEQKLNTTIVDPQKLQLAGKFILALKQFSLVKDACFGQTLDVQNYETYIKQFMTTYRSLPISIPLKLHVLESHAVEFLKDMGEQFGLGFFSEQSYEAMHKKQKANWGTTPLREDHPEYGPKLKALVVNSNGKNL